MGIVRIYYRAIYSVVTLAKFRCPSRIIEHVSPNFLHKTAVQLNRDDQLCDFREVFGRRLLEFGHGNHLEYVC